MIRSLFMALLPLLFCPQMLAAELAPIISTDAFLASYDDLPSLQLASCEIPITETAMCETQACECKAPVVSVGVDLLVWQPHMRSLDYASTEDGTSLAIGAGATHRVGFDRDAGVRVKLERVTKVGWGIGVTYTNFESDGTASVNRPPGIGQLFSTLGHPGGPEEADVATASASLDYNVFDLAIRMRALDQRYRSVDFFGGLRWAKIDNELNAVFDGRDYVNGLIADRMEVDAFGLFFGTEAHWRMAMGWSIFGRTSIAGLYGEMKNTRTETNLNGFEQLVDFQDSYEDPIFNLDARVGLQKTTGNILLSAGYDMSMWTGIGDRIRFTDDIEEAAFSAASGDLLLEGFFFQAAFNW